MAKITARGTGRNAPFRSQLQAWYSYRRGVTSVNGKCSAWADMTNQNRNLLQATAANRPTVQSDGSLLFDGVAQYMQASFTLAQPCTFAMAFTQLTWTSGDIVIDGSTSDMKVTQTGSTPALQANAGSSLTGDSSIALNARAVLMFYANGASSVYSACGGAAPVSTTGDAGANSPGGITIGAARAAANFGNIAVREILIYSGTFDATSRQRILRYLGEVGNVGGI